MTFYYEAVLSCFFLSMLGKNLSSLWFCHETQNFRFSQNLMLLYSPKTFSGSAHHDKSDQSYRGCHTLFLGSFLTLQFGTEYPKKEQSFPAADHFLLVYSYFQSHSEHI